MGLMDAICRYEESQGTQFESMRHSACARHAG